MSRRHRQGSDQVEPDLPITPMLDMSSTPEAQLAATLCQGGGAINVEGQPTAVAFNPGTDAIPAESRKYDFLFLI